MASLGHSPSRKDWGCSSFAQAALLSLVLSACGGGGGSGGSSGYALSGTIAGLGTGKQILLLSGAGTQLTLKANGNFRFNEGLVAGARYSVTVGEQPVGQTCGVASGSNAAETAGVKADVTNVTVVCSDNTLSISGSVTGLPLGATLTLANGSQSQVTVNTNGAFAFPVRVSLGASYSVTVPTQPVGATCSVVSGAGTVGTSGVSNVDVRCIAASYIVGGSVTGLGTGATLGLRLNDGTPLSIVANGPYSFSSSVTHGSGYKVSVSTQPMGQTCTIANGQSNSASAAVTDVQVVCANRQYRVGGSVSGLTAVPSGQRLVLRNNGLDEVTIDAAGIFSFSQPVAHGASSNVTIARQPTGQTCTVIGGSSASVTADISSVQVQCLAVVWRTSLLAGSGAAASTDGSGAQAAFHGPAALAVDPWGRLIVTDASSSRIRRVIVPQGSVATIAGAVVAGYADSATGLSAAFQGPSGVAVDAQGNIFIADTLNHVIRRISVVNGAVTTLAGSGQAGASDGVGAGARFNAPRGLAIDSRGDLIVADSGNHAVRRVSPDGTVSTLAGQLTVRGQQDGPAASAQFSGPSALAIDASGTIYVADTQNSLIRAIVNLPASPVVRTVAGSGVAGLGDGEGTFASFSLPSGIAVDSAGNLFVADTANHVIRQVLINGTVGTVLTIAGSSQPGGQDGVGAAVGFSSPAGLAVAPGGVIYVVEATGQRVRALFRSAN